MHFSPHPEHAPGNHCGGRMCKKYSAADRDCSRWHDGLSRSWGDICRGPLRTVLPVAEPRAFVEQALALLRHLPLLQRVALARL